MYPEDRVLVATIPSRKDFNLLQQEGWYRIPQKTAPKGLYAEYFAFYFGQAFGKQKWAVQYYGQRLGHELVRRRELLPDEPAHPRANEIYYKVSIGNLTKLARPIPSLRWRRVAFIHTTGDRFLTAVELNDLFLDGTEYVNRIETTLREKPDLQNTELSGAELSHEYRDFR